MFDGRRPPGVDVDEDTLVCEHCGLNYKDFRTGLTFGEVKSMYWVNNPDSSTWKYKRRNTVLGKWHEIKGKMWLDHLYFCAGLAMMEAEDA